MSNSKAEARARVDTAADRTLDTADVQIARVGETLKLKIAFYDRLLLLSGATITLTFTVTSSLHLSTGKHLEATALLLWSWKLLIYAILACLAANWMSVVLNITQTTAVMQSMALMRSKLLKMAVHEYKPGAPFPDNELSPEEVKKQAVKTKSRVITEKVSNYIGFSAQLAVAGAYILLLRFLARNISNI
jgi:hypothetical protein